MTNALKAKILTTLMLVSTASCKSIEPNRVNVLKENRNGTTNIVKVLNRVSCKKEQSYCPQEMINNIWNTCLKEGYVKTIPELKVISSRDIKELVNGVVIETYKDPKQLEDANGVVTESTSDYDIKEYSSKVSGYCIGSEYVVENNYHKEGPEP